ncbi:patatin-like phospholipase family protein [Nafulsella turpanensis]|uniref:patatin-like phospholipase family protein n=1 Tax=Nafulsella turpanensis TaxID=1265690 RepID=UPI000348E818|nr:patatin-like phospholipase family protein [Nafulsella turpanensis]
MEKEKRNQNNTYQNGIVLSGGAYRGMGQIGALKALEEKGVKPDVLCGTSSGAINSVLYASGYTPDEMADIWCKEPFGQVLELHFPKFGLLRPARAGELMQPYLKHDRLEDLPIKTILCCSSMNNGKQKVLEKGNLLKILEACCAVPVAFEPVEIDGEQCVDGGLVSNLPAEPLTGKCERLIGITVNPIPEKEELGGLRDTIVRTAWIALESTVDKTRQLCDWVIEPPELGRHGLTDRSALDIFFNAGYEYTCHFLEEKGV